jgi:hypothetical protein
MWKLMVKWMMEKKFRTLDMGKSRKEMKERIQFAKELFRGAKFRVVRGD